MKSTKLENPINQLKGINEILKDESFLYPHKDTIRKFFSNHSDVTNYLVITYNIVNGNIDVYDTNSADEAIYKSKLFDTILIAMFEFEDFCSDPNKNLENKSLISKMQECILEKYKRNLKILLVDNPSVLKYSTKFNDTDVFPFQYLGSLEEQVEYFGVNCTYLIDDNGNLKKEAEHLHFIYKMYKERELNNIINGSSSFDDLIKYYKVFSEDLDSLLETYIGAIFEKDVNDLENGNITFNNPKLFEVVSSLISYIPGGEKESTASKLITGKLFEYIKRFQSERTDVDLIGSRDFKLPYSSTRTRLATSLSNKISKDFCLNVSLFGVNYESLGQGFGDQMLNSSIGILLESGIKIKIRLLSQTQKDDSYSGELKSLVSTTDQWYYTFEWLENLSDDKKELVSFNKSEVEAIEFLLDKKIIETETPNVVEFLKSFN